MVFSKGSGSVFSIIKKEHYGPPFNFFPDNLYNLFRSQVALITVKSSFLKQLDFLFFHALYNLDR